MYVRKIMEHELAQLLQLYTQLHDNPLPEDDASVPALWQRILNDPDQSILVAVEDGQIVSSCVLLIVPNLTHNQRPYGLIENVVTGRAYRKRGYASAVLQHAKEQAMRQGCYKLMLLTGAKDAATLNFYRRAGYRSSDKTGFVQWL